MKDSSAIFYQLSRPFGYLFIKHDDKYIYDWLIPGGALCVFAFLFFLSDIGVDKLFALASNATGLVNGLPGFFIAALAAVATFNRSDMDKKMDGEHSPTISTKVGDQRVSVPLTRRRFLCMLFAYLTAESLLISIMGMIPKSFNFFGEEGVDLNISIIGAWVYLGVYFFMFLQLMISTLYGLYYLGERVHY